MNTLKSLGILLEALKPEGITGREVQEGASSPFGSLAVGLHLIKSRTLPTDIINYSSKIQILSRQKMLISCLFWNPIFYYYYYQVHCILQSRKGDAAAFSLQYMNWSEYICSMADTLRTLTNIIIHSWTLLTLTLILIMLHTLAL